MKIEDFTHLKVLHCEITTKCNLRCYHCQIRSAAYRGEEMSYDVFKLLLGKMKESRPLVILSGHGEPLTHSNWGKIFRGAMTRSGAVEFQTNGQLLTPELLKIMCSAPGYWARVKVSCDGIGETYERIRGAPFSRLDTNLSAYRAYSGKKPALTIEYVAMQHNWHQLREVAQKAVAWGADCLQVSDLHVWPDLPEMRHLDAESLCGIRKSLKRDLDDVLEYGRRNGLRIEVTTDTAAEIGWPVEQFRNNVVTAPTLCLVPHEVAFITASGDVLPCCRVRSSPVGSLKTEDLGSIWIGEKAQVFRKSVEREDTMCAECRLCACRRNWA